MSEYRSTFPKRHTFIPVVHARNTEHARLNAHVAFENGADGVFFINHAISAGHLQTCYGPLREAFSNHWLGFNWLDISEFHSGPLALMQAGMNGLWVDNAGVDSDARHPTLNAELFARERRTWEKTRRASFLYFGGVAFKYQPLMTDPAEAARLAMPFVDVITTSGKGTGSAPSVEKIRMMKEAIGDHPLAIASGISPENVRDFKPHADCFLVATSITEGATDNLIPERVREFADVLRNA